MDAFDLKISKLTGSRWTRTDLPLLGKELLEGQGKERYSIENRIMVLFDGANTSKTSFFKKHESLICERLLAYINDPYPQTVWLTSYNCWQGVILIPPTEFTNEDEYYEHSIGKGLREPLKAEFHQEVLHKVEEMSGGLMKANPNYKEHGKDGWVDINKNWIKFYK